jgi:hypothetical protein
LIIALISGVSWAQAPELYVLDYASIAGYSIEVRGFKHKLDEFPLQVTYIRAPGWNAVVGTGLSDTKWVSQSKPFKLVRYVPPMDLLKVMKVEPSDVKAVILPSLAYADLGGLSLFPSAEIYVNSSDFSDQTRTDVRNEDVLLLVRAAEQGRVRVWRGASVEVTPSVHLHEAPPGSLGRAFVTVKTTRGTVLLGGEVLHSDMWYRKILPDVSGRVYRRVEEVRKQLQINEKFVIPGHDLDIRRFPELTRGVYRIE